MKELFIAFVIALAIGSMLNGANWSPLGAMQPASANLQPPAMTAGQELVQDIDEGSFQGYVLDANEPVLVEFYTDNCPICVKMAPLLGKIALNGQGAVRVCKVNASKSQNLADRYGVSGVPTFYIFDRGQVKDSVAGGLEGDDLRAWLAKHDIRLPAMPTTGSGNGEGV